MRLCSSSLPIALLLLLPTLFCQLLQPGSALAAGSAERRPPAPATVSVSVDRRGYTGDTPVRIRVDNRTAGPIALPGCATYSIEQFVQDRFVPLEPKRCEWEGDAVIVPPGPREFEFKPPQTSRVILRVVVTWASGCRDGVPLSRARCERFETAYSRPFVVTAAAEP